MEIGIGTTGTCASKTALGRPSGCQTVSGGWKQDKEAQCWHRGYHERRKGGKNSDDTRTTILAYLILWWWTRGYLISELLRIIMSIPGMQWLSFICDSLPCFVGKTNLNSKTLIAATIASLHFVQVVFRGAGIQKQDFFGGFWTSKTSQKSKYICVVVPVTGGRSRSDPWRT